MSVYITCSYIYIYLDREKNIHTVSAQLSPFRSLSLFDLFTENFLALSLSLSLSLSLFLSRPLSGHLKEVWGRNRVILHQHRHLQSHKEILLQQSLMNRTRQLPKWLAFELQSLSGCNAMWEEVEIQVRPQLLQEWFFSSTRTPLQMQSAMVTAIQQSCDGSLTSFLADGSFKRVFRACINWSSRWHPTKATLLNQAMSEKSKRLAIVYIPHTVHVLMSLWGDFAKGWFSATLGQIWETVAFSFNGHFVAIWPQTSACDVNDPYTFDEHL